MTKQTLKERTARILGRDHADQLLAGKAVRAYTPRINDYIYGLRDGFEANNQREADKEENHDGHTASES